MIRPLNGGKMAKIDTLFVTKTAENHTLWDRTYLYSPYKGVPLGVHVTNSLCNCTYFLFVNIIY